MKPPTTPSNNRFIDDEDDEVEVADITAPTATPVAPSVRTAEKVLRRKRRNEGRGSYPGRRMVTAYLERKEFLWMKTISVQTDKTMLELFEEAIKAYIGSYAAQQRFK